MLRLYISNDKVFVWKSSDAIKLRKEHRIIGSFVGSLFRLSFQNTESGLPMLLLPEEVTLLLEKKIAVLVSNAKIGDIPDTVLTESFQQYRYKLLKQQEDSQTHSVSPNILLVQQFTECPWKDKHFDEVIPWSYPSSEQEKMRYTIFKDLWEKGYYLTPGAKFGGDYLAYAGDPELFHALFIIVCVPWYLNMKSLDLVVLGRMGNQVKKATVLASVRPDGTADYISLAWDSERF